MRADARRNQEAILAVAREAFTDEGPHVPLDEIAKRAGVSPATLFRHFAGRDELVTAVAVERFATAVEPVIADALADEDAWRGLVAVVDAVLRLGPSSPGWRETVAFAREAGLMADVKRERLYGPVGELLMRARRAGQVRRDATVDDVVPVLHMLRSLATIDGDLADDAWLRYLTLLLRRDAARSR
jgi:AcrR family transcriptional regulator